MVSQDSLNQLELEVVSCTKCPRLVRFREQVATTKKKQFMDWDYWGRPVPGFGDPNAHLLIVGLAPAPHGGNRTGRVFTGDKSADFLVKALHRAGFANQAVSTSRQDGLRLKGVYITAAVKCAPPDNKPTRGEATNCSSFLQRELSLLPNASMILCLGQFAYNAVVEVLKARYEVEVPIPKFRHGLEARFGQGIPLVFASYHPSPRNTQTGKLTERMFQALLTRIQKLRRTLEPIGLAKEHEKVPTRETLRLAADST